MTRTGCRTESAGHPYYFTGMRVSCLMLVVAAVLAVRPAGAQTTQPPRKPPAPAPRPAPRPVPVSTPVLQTPMARIAGEVYDSIAGAPLPEATVQFVEAANPVNVRSVRTDSVGAFVLDSMRVGTYLVGIIHERVDRLGLENRVVQVNIVGSGAVALSLGLPSVATMLATLCSNMPLPPGTGAFVGLVRTARGTPLDGQARVRVQYPETFVTPSGVSRRFPSRFADASPSGMFVHCGIPLDATITTRAYAGADSSGVIELPMARSGLLIRDLLVSQPQRVAKAPVSPTDRPQMLLKGAGRVRGIVRDTAGKPLVGARLSLPGTGAEASSSGSGAFAMDALPSGTWMLEARAVGFEPRRVAVDLRDSMETVAQIDLEALAPRMDTVKVQGDRWSREMAAFEARRRQGGGYYLDDEQITKRNPIFTADLLRGTPGVTIQPGAAGGRDRVLMRGAAGGGSCIPALFVNGMLTPTPDGILENIVTANDVRAVEVYSRMSSTPPEYQSRNGCGSIVIWTGARRR